MSFKTVKVYGASSKLPENVVEQLVEDHSQCALGITCGNGWDVNVRELRRAAPIGVYLRTNSETGADTPAWADVAALAVNEFDTPVLCCVDCAGWLCDLFGAKFPMEE